MSKREYIVKTYFLRTVFSQKTNKPVRRWTKDLFLDEVTNTLTEAKRIISRYIRIDRKGNFATRWKYVIRRVK